MSEDAKRSLELRLKALEAMQEHWFVLRDLRRHNARRLAYEDLEEEGFDVFVPLTWRSYFKNGLETKRQVPAVGGLLFVHSARVDLDPVINKMGTLQYRYVRGGGYCVPMTVRDSEMENFIAIARASVEPCYYKPGEVTPGMVGSTVRIVGGPLDGKVGKLMKVRGTSNRRLYVEVPGVVGLSVVLRSGSVGWVEVPGTPKGELFRPRSSADASRDTGGGEKKEMKYSQRI